MTRKNSLTRQVRRAYRQDTLARVCTLREDRFGRAYGMETVTAEPKYKSSWSSSDRPEDYYHFRDNGSSVLAVAHLDTVVRPARRTPHFGTTKNGPYIRSGALDDRLGAYVILNLLPRLGVNCDWLLTVGEESGQSTAEHFKPAKNYDWAIEFDRMGTDVVMYQYEDRASRKAVEAAGAEMGSGSFSDIAYLEHLGVKAFNWGVGYRGNYHSEAGYAYLDDTFAMVARYMRFTEQNAGLAMPHDADDYGYGKYDNRYDECLSCGQKDVDPATGYCRFCGICQDCGAGDPDMAEEWGDADADADVCQCYTPRSTQPAARADTGTWTPGMTWEEFMAQRYGAEAPAGTSTIANHVTCIMAGPDTPASHEHAGQDGLWTAARRSPSIAPPWSEHAPRRDYGAWHAAAEGLDGLNVVAHTPGAGWNDVCARCAARWPEVMPAGDRGTTETALAILDSRTLSVSDR